MQVKSLEGPVLKTVAVAEEVVRDIVFRKPYLMSRGSNSMINFCY